jgi:hypothetical protein
VGVNQSHRRKNLESCLCFNVAAFLLVRGFQIALVDLAGGTATFTFNDPEQRAESVNARVLQRWPSGSQ